MRFTLIERGGGISFVGDSRMLDALVAACALDPTTTSQLLDAVDLIDKRVRLLVLDGLAVFDEHNTRENLAAIRTILEETRGQHTPPFRILDEVTRAASLQPVRSGLVIFNLRDRRIIQVQNTYRDVVRRGAVQLHDGQRWIRGVRHYDVPGTWAIVP